MKVLDSISILLRHKGNEVFSIPPGASVYSAIEMMADRHVGALLVIDENHLIGIISERDYARKIILQGKSSKDTFVREIMTPSPVTIHCETTVDEAMRTMTDHHIRHLPVVDNDGHVAGVLSIGDLVNWITTTQDETIDHLQHYIAGDLTH